MLEMDVAFTGERFVPGLGGAQIAAEHGHRYTSIREVVAGKRVLDLGCGTGYGALLLSKAASYVGVDIDSDSVDAARRSFGAPRIDFRVGDVMATDLAAESFDVVVCFEVIEHLSDPLAVVREAKRLLGDQGLFVVSTPDKVIYNASRDEPNPFHPSELTEEEFRATLSAHFRHTQLFGQRFTACSGIFDPEQTESPGFVYLPDGSLGVPPRAMYWLGLASDSPLPVYRPSALLLAEGRDLGGELVTAVKQLGVYEEELESRSAAMLAAQAELVTAVKQLGVYEEELESRSAAMLAAQDAVSITRGESRRLRDEVATLEAQVRQLVHERETHPLSRLARKARTTRGELKRKVNWRG